MHVSVIKMLIIKFSEVITDKVLLDNQLSSDSIIFLHRRKNTPCIAGVKST